MASIPPSWRIRMKDSFEYQIYIGCNDSQLHTEIVSEAELKDMVSRYFERIHMDFSLLSLKGSYLYENGWYITEDTLCINIIGNSSLNIKGIVRGLSMYMNQKCCLIVRKPLKTDFC
jgi:hypothetical protein